MPYETIGRRLTSDNAGAISGAHSIAESFHRRSQERPDAPAVVWRDTVTSYRQLADHVSRARQQLAAMPDGPTGVLLDKSPNAIALVLALLGSGRPVVAPSPDLTADTLTTLFRQAGCAAVLATTDPPPAGLAMPVHAVESTAGPVAVGEPQTPAVTSFMFTTSGSTGLPKVVPLSTAAVGRFVRWAAERFEIGPGRTVLSYAPFNFDLSLLDVWTTLSTGGCVVLVESELATRPGHLYRLLRRHRVQVVQAVPMLFQLLLGHRDRAPLPDVTHVISTGDALPPRCLAQLPELFPRARLHNVYGCTETNDSFVYEIPAGPPVGELPIGQPIAGVHAIVVDEHGHPLTGPGRGELHVSTPFQATGYLDPALDAGRFVPGPDGVPLFRSGDLVDRRPDGALFLAGRTDHVVKVRGVRVSTQEVERVLAEHPDVCAVAVVAMPDPVAGSTLHAVVQRRDSSVLDSLRLRQFCAQRLPRSSIPSAIRLLDQPLPRTSTGKPDRHRIRCSMTEED